MTRRLVAMPDPELLDPLRTALEAQDLNAFTELLCPDVAWGPRVIRTLRAETSATSCSDTSAVLTEECVPLSRRSPLSATACPSAWP